MLTFINRTEIQGIVHSVDVTKINGSGIAILIICTEYAYRDGEGLPVIETTWHRVTCDAKKFPEVAKINKGQAVNVKGRGRNIRYADASGCNRCVHDIVAESLETVEPDQP